MQHYPVEHIPAEASQPREINHFWMPMIEGGMKPFKTACLSIWGQLFNISQENFGGKQTF